MSNFLREQAVRLRRTKWKDKVDLLADEIFQILSSVPDTSPGQVTIDQGDGLPPITLPPNFTDSPFGDFVLPDLDLPSYDSNPVGVERTAIPDPLNGLDNQPTRYLKTTKYIQRTRVVCPGVVVSGSGDTYRVRLYPNGLNDGSSGGSTLTVTAKQLQIASTEAIPAGTWALVWRYTESEVELAQIVESGAGTAGEREVSRETRVRVVRREHCMQVPVWLS